MTVTAEMRAEDTSHQAESVLLVHGTFSYFAEDEDSEGRTWWLRNSPFAKELDDMRRQMADSYLCESGVAIGEVWLLG